MTLAAWRPIHTPNATTQRCSGIVGSRSGAAVCRSLRIWTRSALAYLLEVVVFTASSIHAAVNSELSRNRRRRPSQCTIRSSGWLRHTARREPDPGAAPNARAGMLCAVRPDTSTPAAAAAAGAPAPVAAAAATTTAPDLVADRAPATLSAVCRRRCHGRHTCSPCSDYSAEGRCYLQAQKTTRCRRPCRR
jgi:hypothetical protein